MHRVSMLSCSPFSVVEDALTELGRHGVLSELVHAGDLVLMNETIERIGNLFRK